jgi:FkbM family methyltransferase
MRDGIAFKARRLFYRAGGPWLRRGLFEAVGSTRYSKPALYELDDRLAGYLPDRPGVFVEAGAHDGYTQSNTYWLERQGWSGVLVEAIPALAAKARSRRRRSQLVNSALVSDARPGDTVTITYGDLMSVVADVEGAPAHAAQGARTAGSESYEVEVPARTLTQVLDEAGVGEVDLLVLDIEGLELDVLRGLDLGRHAPRLMLIEMLEMARQRPSFDELLAARYEPVEALSPYDMLYRRRD